MKLFFQGIQVFGVNDKLKKTILVRNGTATIVNTYQRNNNNNRSILY